MGYSLWSHKESDTTERLTHITHLNYIYKNMALAGSFLGEIELGKCLHHTRRFYNFMFKEVKKLMLKGVK